MAEDQTAIILRLYEAFNRRTKLTIRFTHPLKAVYLCNMLENPEYEIPCSGSEVKYEIKPYEIATFKIYC